MVIVAIVGLPGAGKTEAQKVFAKKGWNNVYCGAIVFDELEKRGLEVNERNERKVREDLRKQYGPMAVELLSMPKVEETANKGDMTIESFYTWTSYKEYKDKFGHEFIVLAIQASPKTREKRLQVREKRPLSPEETKSRTHAQIENLDQAGPIACADYHIINESSLEDLYGAVEELIATLK